MKVIGILSSPRGSESQTGRLAIALGEGLEAAGAEVEWADVCRMKIEYCRACDVCHRIGDCIHHDGFGPIRERMLLADGIVFTSPDYFRSVTAQLKTAIDRMSDVIHCQLFRGKYACSLSTSGGPNAAEVTTYLDDILLSLGACVVGSVAVSVRGGPQAIEEGEARARVLGRELAEAIASKRVYPEQQARHRQTAEYFRQVVEANRGRWPHEAALWARSI